MPDMPDMSDLDVTHNPTLAMPSFEYSVFHGSRSGHVVPVTLKRSLQPTDALVEISYAGLCGADRLSKNKNVPLGHHGTGIVRDIGSAVQLVKVGDQVGFAGTQVPCGSCDYCIAGTCPADLLIWRLLIPSDKEQYCEQRAHFEKVGSFATHAIWHEKMLIQLPAGGDPKTAASLMCGGAIMWEILTSYNIRPGDRIGVHGLGGLGHVAVQFTRALGCEVVVFCSSLSKHQDAMAIGANEFHVTHDLTPQTPVQPVQHLLWCRDAAPNFDKIMPQIACAGTVYILSVGLGAVTVPAQSLVANGIRIQGSCGASRRTVRKMLRFVQLHGIRPVIMNWPMTSEGIEAAFCTLEEGKMRYRGVLVGHAHATVEKF